MEVENSMMDEEFWRLPKVIAVTGLSRAELYRQVGEGRFPKQRRYPGTQKTYWLASEVRGWMDIVLSGAMPDFESMLG